MSGPVSDATEDIPMHEFKPLAHEAENVDGVKVPVALKYSNTSAAAEVDSKSKKTNETKPTLVQKKETPAAKLPTKAEVDA
jgi:hypothetical protein